MANDKAATLDNLIQRHISTYLSLFLENFLIQQNWLQPRSRSSRVLLAFKTILSVGSFKEPLTEWSWDNKKVISLWLSYFKKQAKAWRNSSTESFSFFVKIVKTSNTSQLRSTNAVIRGQCYKAIQFVSNSRGKVSVAHIEDPAKVVIALRAYFYQIRIKEWATFTLAFLLANILTSCFLKNIKESCSFLTCWFYFVSSSTAKFPL